MLSIFCLKNNIPVIFWKDSMMYRFYTENGFHVFAIEDLDSYPAHVTKDQKENNIYHNSSIKKIAPPWRCIVKKTAKLTVLVVTKDMLNQSLRLIS
jgi:hypothetical protein